MVRAVQLGVGILGVVGTLILAMMSSILLPIAMVFLFDANDSNVQIQNCTSCQTVLNATPIFVILTPFFVIVGGMVATVFLFFQFGKN